MNGWIISIIVITFFFLLVLLINYRTYYRKHKVEMEKNAKNPINQLDDAEEVTKRETLRQRMRQAFIRP
ncbi:MAG: hypothetical protein KAU62_13390 [Candidatus Heimdallarchaeota archaeon]|nr:hypothetical protein [Candidatus Heimdallarchaeota archaeon]MCG3257086.1 hypothetical protein [Candidatus Heimdallarchaeota archaeon]MCK4612146.1 hypothetical protein [Candidatus Heimdallarchaeota archaeon]